MENSIFITNDKLGIKLLGTVIKQSEVGETTSLTFEAGSPVNTQKIIELSQPESPVYENALIIKNPSEVSDLVVRVFNVEDGIGDSLLTSLTIPKKSAIPGDTPGVVDSYTVLLNGMFLSGSTKLVISNTEQDAEAFTVIVRVREVR